MKRLIKIGFILLSIGIFAAFGTYLYVFHKPHRNIAREAPAYRVDARQLYDEFNNNEDSSYSKYADKVLQVTGPVAEVSTSTNSANITLLDRMSGISFGFDSLTLASNKAQLESIREGDTITIKGKCDGYDMIMGVVLTRSIVISQ